MKNQAEYALLWGSACSCMFCAGCDERSSGVANCKSTSEKHLQYAKAYTRTIEKELIISRLVGGHHHHWAEWVWCCPRFWPDLGLSACGCTWPSAVEHDRGKNVHISQMHSKLAPQTRYLTPIRYGAYLFRVVRTVRSTAIGFDTRR